VGRIADPAPHDRGQRLPIAPQVVLGIPQGHAGAAAFDPRLEQIGLVRLADIAEVFGGLHGVIVEPDELAMNLDQALGGHGLEIRDPNAIEHPHLLGDGLPAGGAGFLGELGAAEPELAGCDNLLLDEGTDVVSR
jgi:hypothetical protein